MQISKETRENIFRDIAAGMPKCRVADKYGIPQYTVYEMTKGYPRKGILQETSEGRAMRKAAVIDGYRKGMTIGALAENNGVSAQTVRNWLDEAGIRPKGTCCKPKAEAGQDPDALTSEEFRDQLKHILEVSGLSMRRLSIKMGMYENTVSKCIHGKSHIKRPETRREFLKKAATAAGLDAPESGKTEKPVVVRDERPRPVEAENTGSMLEGRSDIRAIAERFGADAETVRRVLDEEDIPYVSVFGNRFVREDDIVRYVAGCLASPAVKDTRIPGKTARDGFLPLCDDDISRLAGKLAELLPHADDPSKDARIAEAERENMQLRESLGKAETRLAEIRSGLERDLDEKEKRILDLEGELAELKKVDINALNDEYLLLQIENEDLKANSHALQESLKSLRNASSYRSCPLVTTIGEIYPDEVKALLLYLVKAEAERSGNDVRKARKRKFELIDDILNNNTVPERAIEFGNRVRSLPVNCSAEEFGKALQGLGFVKTASSTHAKYQFCNLDSSYTRILPITPSDRRWIVNEKKQIENMLLVD